MYLFCHFNRFSFLLFPFWKNYFLEECLKNYLPVNNKYTKYLFFIPKFNRFFNRRSCTKRIFKIWKFYRDFWLDVKNEKTQYKSTDIHFFLTINWLFFIFFLFKSFEKSFTDKKVLQSKLIQNIKSILLVKFIYRFLYLTML